MRSCMASIYLWNWGFRKTDSTSKWWITWEILSRYFIYYLIIVLLSLQYPYPWIGLSWKKTFLLMSQQPKTALGPFSACAWSEIIVHMLQALASQVRSFVARQPGCWARGADGGCPATVTVFRFLPCLAGVHVILSLSSLSSFYRVYPLMLPPERHGQQPTVWLFHGWISVPSPYTSMKGWLGGEIWEKRINVLGTNHNLDVDRPIKPLECPNTHHFILYHFIRIPQKFCLEGKSVWLCTDRQVSRHIQEHRAGALEKGWNQFSW